MVSNLTHVASRTGALPPGQRRVDGFPRFGTHVQRPPPAVPATPMIEVDGAVTRPFALPLAELATLPRRAMTADFHCVAGWSATGLRWEGVAFEQLYRAVLEPALRPGAVVTHVVLGGLDGYRSVLSLEDALAEDVLVADRLDGRPLDGNHGAPARLVSPAQYGYVSTKHLCRTELRTTGPRMNFGASSSLVRTLMRPPLFSRHPRSRVWEEERNGALPNWFVRPVYRLLTPPLRLVCALGSRPRSQG